MRGGLSEGRALCRFAVNPDVASALLDDSINDRKAEAGSFARGLRCKEGFEQVSTRVFVSARASMGDGYHDIRTGRGHVVRSGVVLIEIYIGGGDGEFAALGHGIAGV